MNVNIFFNNHMLSYKHNESNTFVHVRNKELFLSKGLFDQYYFLFTPMSTSIDKLIPIHRDSNLYLNDKEFNSIMSVFIQVLLHNYNDFDPHKLLEENNYSLVDTYENIDTRDAIAIISKLPRINDKHYLDTATWISAGIVQMDGTPRELFCTEDELIVKYDSPDSNKGMYAYSVFFQTQSTGEIFGHRDSIFNIELPYSLYGNLINIITVDEYDRCINQEEYEKYIALSKYMVAPRLEERKPL